MDSLGHRTRSNVDATARIIRPTWMDWLTLIFNSTRLKPRERGVAQNPTNQYQCRFLDRYNAPGDSRIAALVNSFQYSVHVPAEKMQREESICWFLVRSCASITQTGILVFSMRVHVC